MIKIVQILPDDWKEMSSDFHKAVFNEIRPVYMDRIDYGVVFDVDGMAIGYATVRELDSESAYIQYGGKLDGTSPHQSVEAISQFMDWLLEKYKRVNCLVNNQNMNFMKIAHHVGMRIIGMRTFGSEIFLEMMKERGN